MKRAEKKRSEEAARVPTGPPFFCAAHMLDAPIMLPMSD